MDIWSTLWPFDIFYGHLVYFVVIWYISPLLVYCTKRNLATLRIASAQFKTGFGFELEANIAPAKLKEVLIGKGTTYQRGVL
jgi:hypothetical protein